MARRTFHPTFWMLTRIGSRLRINPSPVVDITTAELPEPELVHIPTRHGRIRALVFRPGPGDRERPPPPVIIHLHGGGFINRHPGQDRHIARHLVAELSAVVVLPDYETAPAVRYPVAEEEAFDVARWIQTHGPENGWDGDRLLVSGVSAGAKLAINICQQLHTDGRPPPLAAALTVPVTDSTGSTRTSPIKSPAISPFVLRMVLWAYFPDAGRRHEALASPRFDASLPACMPPTIVQTGAHDSLAGEGAELAETLKAAGVPVVHHEHPAADHGFYADEPVQRIRAVLVGISDFFRDRLTAAAHP